MATPSWQAGFQSSANPKFHIKNTQKALFRLAGNHNFPLFLFRMGKPKGIATLAGSSLSWQPRPLGKAYLPCLEEPHRAHRLTCSIKTTKEEKAARANRHRMGLGARTRGLFHLE